MTKASRFLLKVLTKSYLLSVICLLIAWIRVDTMVHGIVGVVGFFGFLVTVFIFFIFLLSLFIGLFFRDK